MDKKLPIIILPIQEPWASMIASGVKQTEFRTWEPKTWTEGQTIWVVATGKAKGKRMVIAKCKFKGYGKIESTPKIKKDRDYLSGGIYYRELTLKTLEQQGGKIGDTGIFLSDIEKFEKPFTLESIGIKRTPQKFQYYKKGK